MAHSLLESPCKCFARYESSHFAIFSSVGTVWDTKPGTSVSSVLTSLLSCITSRLAVVVSSRPHRCPTSSIPDLAPPKSHVSPHSQHLLCSTVSLENLENPQKRNSHWGGGGRGGPLSAAWLVGPFGPPWRVLVSWGVRGRVRPVREVLVEVGLNPKL